MMTSPRGPRVFLSYASEDAENAGRLRPLLKVAGFGPWLDSDALSTQEPWETAMGNAIAASDFVVALLSRGTRTSRQDRELRRAIGDSPDARGSGKPLILPCAVTGSRTAAFEDVAPQFLRPWHVVDFTDFDVGWQQLYESLYKAARSAGFWVPKLLRAVPQQDLDRAAVTRMVVTRGLFSKAMNASGGVEEAELRLASGGLVVEDKSSGRMWTRGCINPDVLPQAPLPTVEEEVAHWTPAGQQSDEQKALIAARQDMKRRMRLAIEEWTTRLNRERLGGYDDWRLPTLEEAMSLMRRSVRNGGVHISDLFSDHEYIRTADGSPGPRPMGLPEAGFQTIWIVGYADADCLEVAEEARVPLRFVRTDLD
jgi:hypothetical protein